MSQRYTRQDVAAAGKIVAKAMGREFGRGAGEVGVDYASCYGGYKLVEYSETGGEWGILGERRRSAKEFCETMHAVAAALGYVEQNRRAAEHAAAEGMRLKKVALIAAD